MALGADHCMWVGGTGLGVWVGQSRGLGGRAAEAGLRAGQGRKLGGSSQEGGDPGVQHLEPRGGEAAWEAAAEKLGWMNTKSTHCLCPHGGH